MCVSRLDFELLRDIAEERGLCELTDKRGLDRLLREPLIDLVSCPTSENVRSKGILASIFPI